MKTENGDEKKQDENLEGYPHYPKSEDIYSQFDEEEDLNPEDPTEEKTEIDSNAIRQEELDKLVERDNLKVKERELDVPGSDLDETGEAREDKDEENQYYSLGGDRHEGLEEDRQDL